MKLKLTRVNVMLAVVVLALAGFFLRLAQMAMAFDDAGRVTGKGVVFFSLFSIAVTVLFALYSLTLKRRKGISAIAGQDLPVLAVSAAATVLMLGGSAALLIRPLPTADATDRIIAIGGILTALCWGAVAAMRYLDKKLHAGLFMVPALYYVVALVLRFRFWTRDPIIIDYCYDLFALISLMCANFHLGGFCMEEGQRRLTAFYTLCGIFFSAAALVQSGKAAGLTYAAAILWLLANLWLLLRPSRQRSAPFTAAVEVTEEPAEEAETDETEETGDLP